MGRRPRCKNDSNVVRLYDPIARSRTVRTLVANATTSLRSATLTATTVLEILMDVEMLRADCARCAGLCCVVLAFDRSALFAEDKPAGTPCIHLGSDCRCRIHASRKQRGYAGCVSYDCLGAGQRATALLIGCAATAVEQFEVFAAIHRQHELLTLLHAADALPLSLEHRVRREALLQQTEAADMLSAAGRRTFLAGPLPGEVRTFLSQLRSYVDDRHRSDRLAGPRRQLPV